VEGRGLKEEPISEHKAAVSLWLLLKASTNLYMTLLKNACILRRRTLGRPTGKLLEKKARRRNKGRRA